MQEQVDDRTTYSNDDIMINVVVAQIDPKQASTILQSYATSLPLQQYNLTHMKRVRRDMVSHVLEVLICPVRCYDDVSSSLKEMCKPVTRVITVPRLAPLTRAEYDEWGEHWPTLFRPNAVDKERERGHTDEEVSHHVKYMTLMDEDALRASKEWSQLFGDQSNPQSSTSPPFRGGGIVVNPENGSVSRCVCSPPFYWFCVLTLTYVYSLSLTHSFDCNRLPCRSQVVTMSHTVMQYVSRTKGANALRNPLLDSTMLCIEGVAAAVRGEDLPCCCAVGNNSSSSSSSSSKSNDSSSSSGSMTAEGCRCHEHSLPDDQYLCTGLDLYLTYEPDIMVGMALVHSRIRRVFYRHKCPLLGALGSRHSIHSLRSLNHHYRVWCIS